MEPVGSRGFSPRGFCYLAETRSAESRPTWKRTIDALQSMEVNGKPKKIPFDAPRSKDLRRAKDKPIDTPRSMELRSPRNIP
mgnify:CR=1 FL=1